MQPLQKRSWAEISHKSLAHNYRALRALLPRGCRFMGIVKANAYGHGAVPIALQLQGMGAEYIGVASLDEAIALREGGVTAGILVLGYTSPSLTDALVRYGLTQAVFDRATAAAMAAAAQAAGERVKVHIKVDTGMSRLGFFGATARDEILSVYALDGVLCEGIFTHLANADGSDEGVPAQLGAFLALIAQLEAAGARFPLRHCANSAAMLRWPQTHLDMVRPGIALYGYNPIADRSTLALAPVMTLKTQVCAVRALPAGAQISYGGTHTLIRESMVATLSIGYADGLPRALSGRAQVAIAGRKVPLLGRICMDMTMADVTDLPPVCVGDEVEVFGRQLPAWEKTDAIQTIPYELFCAISARVPRILVD